MQKLGGFEVLLVDDPIPTYGHVVKVVDIFQDEYVFVV